ncbi:MAG: hypothetical protein ABIX12_06615, partial [Rubrivivax sp.]
HRSSLIQHVDKMLVLDGGRMKHYGPAAEVLQAMNKPAASVGAMRRVELPGARAVGGAPGVAAEGGTA